MLLVIHEHDLSDNEHIVIGVAENVEKAEEMIKGYYGEGNYTEISKTDIRDSNLEYSKILQINELEHAIPAYKVKILLEWFELNKI